jgi:hypothetical protein
MQVCYLRDGDRVFETYWSTSRAAEALAPSYGSAIGDREREPQLAAGPELGG